MFNVTKRILIIICIAAVHNTQALSVSAASQTRDLEDDEYYNGQLDIESDLLTPEQLESTYKIYYTPDKLNGSYSQISFSLLIAQAQLLPRLAALHRYNNNYQILRAQGPDVDQAKCIEQLEELVKRAEEQQLLKYGGLDINFHQLIDTFGRIPAGFLLINTFWPGMYKECQRLRINSKEGSFLDTRYCVASFKHFDWRAYKLGYMIGHEAGVCLPKSCDSMKYENKFELVQRLMDFNAREIDKNEYYVDYLYCLPDEQSEMRMWWKSDSVCISIAIIILWVLVVISCTVMYERVRRESDELSPKSKSTQFIFMKSLSVINNYQLLLGKPSQQDTPRTRQSSVINLRVLDGIKVLALICIVMGHTSGLLLKYSSNMREMIEPSISSVLFETGVQPPSFVVNMFFTITALLATYKLFEKNYAGKVASSPMSWIAFILNRYIRIIPVYSITVMYSKYLAIYAGKGPLWDYGTSAESIRRFCARESWLWTFLLGSNFKPIHEHCIIPGWYIANDFQFFIITPIFIYALFKRPNFGRLLLATVGLSSILATSFLIFNLGLPWIDPIFRASPHSSTLTMTVFGYIYTWPFFRIPAYLFGIYLGYKLHTFEHRKQEQQLKLEADQNETAEFSKTNQLEESDWHPFICKHGTKISLILLAITITIPFQSYNLHLEWDNQLMRFILAQTWPGSHLLMPLAFGCFILPAATGFGNRFLDAFLSADIWRILAKLNLSLLIVHFEVIWTTYSLKSQLVYINFVTHIGLYLVSLLLSYIVAFFLYLLVEAPVGLLMNHIMLKVFHSQTVPKIREKHEMVEKEEVSNGNVKREEVVYLD